MRAARFFLAFSVLGLAACSSAGPYGYSRVYSPLDAEETALEGSREFDPVMARRAPDDWKKAKVSLFGVVTERKDASGGGAYLTLGMRTLAPRNLCDEADQDTCRVTVSAREHAVVHVVVKLKSEDDIGRLSVRPGTLLRIVGHLGEDTDAADGGPVLRADFYRQWPRGEYVTMADSEHMRR
jgi:hypothetical protein